MKTVKVPLFLLLKLCILFPKENLYSNLLVTNNNGEAIITVDSDIHINYGLSYPLTYKFNIPQDYSNLKAYRKFKSDQEWLLVEEKTSEDFFNGIEATRFEYDDNAAYVSIAFSNLSDTIFIKFTDIEDNILNSSFSEICTYYDNREAVVTVTADDWASWNHQNFIETCQNFRSYNLWLSCAVITDIYDPMVWADMQEQLDLGLIEVVAHSRTHPFIPYNDIESEVLGSKQDLIENLELNLLNRYGIREYVYAWVAPYGEYNEDIDTLVSYGNYLTTRLFYWGDNYFSDWDNTLNKFFPVGASIEVGSSSYWGSTDIVELNNTFDAVYSTNGIYHLMTHPNILEWDQDFTWDHLEHISNRKNIWYVGFGHLYLYRFLSNSIQGINLNIQTGTPVTDNPYILIENYPNPFNPKTTIQYSLPVDTFVKIEIYNMLGNKVKNLVNKYQTSGKNLINWDSTNNQGKAVSAGVYLYSLETKYFRTTKKMILLK